MHVSTHVIVRTTRQIPYNMSIVRVRTHADSLCFFFFFLGGGRGCVCMHMHARWHAQESVGAEGYVVVRMNVRDMHVWVPTGVL